MKHPGGRGVGFCCGGGLLIFFLFLFFFALLVEANDAEMSVTGS